MRSSTLSTQIAVVTLMVSATAVASEAPGTRVEVRATPAGLIAVEIELGTENLAAALDTGTSLTMVSSGVARRLRLQPRARSTAVDATGRERPLLLGGPVELRWGGVQARLPYVAWTPGLAELPGADGLDAVLGADALAGTDVLFEAGLRRLRIAPSGTLAAWFDGEAVPVRVIEGRPAVDVELAEAGRLAAPVPLVIDSGANAPVLFGAAAAALAVGAGPGARAAFLAAGAGIDVSTVVLGRGRVGSRWLRLGRTALLPSVTDRTEAGLVPLAALVPLLVDLASSCAITGARLRSAPRTAPLAKLAAASS